jgi:hypothetical protein
MAADRNGPDVRADEHLPFGAMAAADRELAKIAGGRSKKIANAYILLSVPRCPVRLSSE